MLPESPPPPPPNEDPDRNPPDVGDFGVSVLFDQLLKRKNLEGGPPPDRDLIEGFVKGELRDDELSSAWRSICTWRTWSELECSIRRDRRVARMKESTLRRGTE